MEPGGRSEWQPVASGTASKAGETSQKLCDGLRHGKEGVDGSSPSEGFTKAPQNGVFVFGPTCTSPARSSVGRVLEKRVLRRPPTRPSSERALEDRAMFDAHSEKWASGAGTPWPRHRKGAPMQQKRMRGESAKQVAIDVLRSAGEPLHTKESRSAAQHDPRRRTAQRRDPRERPAPGAASACHGKGRAASDEAA
jgi:hypothetical protein